MQSKAILKIRKDVARRTKMRNDFDKREREREQEMMRLNPHKRLVPFLKWFKAKESKNPLIDRNLVKMIIDFQKQ
jgi:hypothetical protein